MTRFGKMHCTVKSRAKLRRENSIDFIDRLKSIVLQGSEIIISFNSLFPSVPVTWTLKYFKELLQRSSLHDNQVNEFVSLTCLCIKKTFIHLLYEQKERTAMSFLLMCPWAGSKLKQVKICNISLNNGQDMWMIFLRLDPIELNVKDVISHVNDSFSTYSFLMF